MSTTTFEEFDNLVRTEGRVAPSTQLTYTYQDRKERDMEISGPAAFPGALRDWMAMRMVVRH
jgi:hypothetical protein